MLLTVKDFNKKYSNIELYKVLKKDYTHNNFKYKDGLNIDTVPFSPVGQCSRGGIYVSELNKLGLWLSYGSYICKVTIPDDSSVYIEEDKFKIDKINLDLTNKVLIKDFYAWTDPNFCNLAVKQDGLALQYVKEQNDELCKLAVQENKYAIKYIYEIPLKLAEYTYNTYASYI